MTDFEKELAFLHAHLNTEVRHSAKLFPRPIFVELNGPPTSGKSTVIKELYNFLKRSGFKVLMPQEGAEVIPHTERNGPAYNIRTALYALQIFLKLREGHEYDFVLFDRCIFDSYVWMLYWHEKGALSKADMVHHQDFFLSLRYGRTIWMPYSVSSVTREYLCKEKTKLLFLKKLARQQTSQALINYYDTISRCMPTCTPASLN